MRYKKAIIIIIVAIVTVVSIVVLSESNINKLKYTDISDIKRLKELNTTNIEEITIHNPFEYYTITKQDDIQLLFSTVQSMKLSRKPNGNKDGFAFLINIKPKNAEIICITILSKDILINGKNYKRDKDYCEIIREVYNKLSVNYAKNPA